MPEIKISSPFVKTGEDIKDGDLITILDGGEERPSPRDKNKKVWNFRVQLPDETSKLMTFNPTSLRALMNAWGSNSDKWVGKIALVEVVKMQIGKERKEVAMLSPSDDDSEEGKDLSDIPVIEDTEE